MKKVLFLAKYSHDFEYFGKIHNHIKAKEKEIESNLLFNIPLFTLGLVYIFAKMPFTKQELEKILEYELQRKQKKYSPIKFKILSILLVFTAKLYFFRYRSFLANKKYDTICMWGGFHVMQQVVAFIARKNNITVFYFENGCLPNTTVMDPKGTNFLSSIPRDKTFYQSISQPFKQINFVERKNFDNSNNVIKLPQHYIFCPFQDWLDSQILLHSPWAKSMENFFDIIEELTKLTPENINFIIKKHPNCKKSYLELELKANKRIIFANENKTYDLIKNADAILTINSSIGIESLMMEKKVITIGNSFYSDIGLTISCINAKEIANAINNLSNWNLDKSLNGKVLSYLQNYYLIQNSYKNCNEEHFNAITKKLIL